MSGAEKVLRGEIIQAEPKQTTLVRWDEARKDIHPVQLYLKDLTPSGRKTQRSGLALAMCILLPMYEISVGTKASKIKPLGQCSQEDREKFNAAVFEFPWWQLTRDDLNVVVASLEQLGYSHHTLSRTRSGIRRVLEECSLKEPDSPYYMTPEAFSKATRRLKKIKGGGNAAGRRLTNDELAALLGACDLRERRYHSGKIKGHKPEHVNIGARDRAMIRLGFWRAFRIREVARLKFEHYHPQTGELRIVKSKNNRSRTITLSGPSKVDFEAWLKIRGTKPGPVFCKIDKIGGLHQDGKFVSPGMIQKRLTMRVRIADIKACTWHDGRRTVLTNLIRLGYLEDAQELAGHTQLATTLSYARYDSERSAEALSALDEFQSEKPEGDENSSE